ncbi:hypothetical protein FACS1894172_05010 [Spirochaetia bacterium]|nr:hypothetical protein FACS1894172_05010 [Spirochaetia bacterium]
MINDVATNDELNFTVNRLILGDNLEILKTIKDETVGLIYLDSPFFSNRNYEVIWGDDGEIRSFQDRWAGGVDHYIGWLFERVDQMHRILKTTGNIYLYCDWHADAYIRVHILDKIFGEIILRMKLFGVIQVVVQVKNSIREIMIYIFLYKRENLYIQTR